MLLISISERLADQPDVTARLLQNPKDISCLLARCFSRDCVREFERLLTEHLEIGANLITALRDGNKNADQLDKDWYINAEKIARTLNRMNRCYDFCEWKNMMFTHLDLTKKEVAAQLAGKYKLGIEAFAAVEKEAIRMADMLTAGMTNR
jgi:hypothetical protein